MKKCLLILILALLSLLTACGNAPEQPVRLVTAVELEYLFQGDRVVRHYTQPEKIDAVLHYLASLRDFGRAGQNPQLLRGPSYRIRLLLSDGSSRLIRQRCGRYLSRDSGHWLLIAPHHATRLHMLLLTYGSDPPERKNTCNR